MPRLYCDRRGAPEQSDGAEEIRERNGVWVVTINGVWRGDYIKHEHAVVAVQAAQHDARSAAR